jgi:CHAD domain-containing protein
MKPDAAAKCFGAGLMLAQLNVLHAESDGAAAGTDLECIHRMRVASRRLRAVLAYFDPVLPAGICQKFQEQVRNVTLALGNSRDLDIQMQALRRFQLMREGESRLAGLDELLTALERQRSQSGEEVRTLIHLFKANTAVATASEVLKRLAVEPMNQPSTPLRLLADQAIRTRLRRLISFTDVMRDPQQIEKLHAMRIAAKRLRYTLEIFAPLETNGFKPWLKRVRGVQEMLGAIHDCDAWDVLLKSQSVTGAGYPPGIQLWMENRANHRARMYTAFITAWDSPAKGSSWDELELHVKANHPAEITHRISFSDPGEQQGAAE